MHPHRFLQAIQSVYEKGLALLFMVYKFPLVPPRVQGLNVARIGTEARVSWTVPSLLEAGGFLTYVVDLSPPRSLQNRRKRQSTGVLCPPSSDPCRVPVQEGGVTLSGLDSDVEYTVSVVAENEDQERGRPITQTGMSVVCLHH